MKLFITFSKRSLAAVLLSLIAALVVLSRVTALSGGGINGSTNAERVNSLGCNVEETAISSKETVIPQSFGKVYERYNSLQKKAGFDLAPFHGREACVYTYRLADEPNTVVNLIVANGCIIGGDISSTALDGFMLPLSSESVKKIET